MTVRADIHIHSCLSPCGSLEMSPSVIVSRAKQQGLSLIGLTDHNSALNCSVFEKLCSKEGIASVCGIEVTTREEVHVLALFPEARQAKDFGGFIYSRLPEIRNVPDTLGDQVIVDEEERITGDVEKYLGSASEIGLDELGEMILREGGLFIPSHIERPMFSLISQLGFIPDLPYSALETVERERRLSPIIPLHGRQIALVRNSDAHYPDAIGRRYITFEAEEASFDRLAQALEKRIHTCYQRS